LGATLPLSESRDFGYLLSGSVPESDSTVDAEPRSSVAISISATGATSIVRASCARRSHPAKATWISEATTSGRPGDGAHAAPRALRPAPVFVLSTRSLRTRRH